MAWPMRARLAKFCERVRSRMRRVLRGHDKTYAVLEAFGGLPVTRNNAEGDKAFWETESYLLDNLKKVAQSRREGGPQFDFYSVDFWHNVAGDLIKFHPQNFPHGFGKVRNEIVRQGMQRRTLGRQRRAAAMDHWR